MNDPESGSTPTPTTPLREPILFAAENPSIHSAAKGVERNWIPWMIALVVICCGLGLAFWLGRPSGNSSSSVDPYARYVTLSHVRISQASNFAGDQLTYVDGILENRGNRTLTAMTVQAAFPNESGDAPQILQAPISLVRSRDPYVDTQPISAAPLPPGKSQDFRLVFDNVSPLWNQAAPQLRVADLSTRP